MLFRAEVKEVRISCDPAQISKGIVVSDVVTLFVPFVNQITVILIQESFRIPAVGSLLSSPLTSPRLRSPICASSSALFLYLSPSNREKYLLKPPFAFSFG